MNYQIVIDQLKLNWFRKKILKRIIYKNLDNHMYCVGDIKSTYHTNAFLHKLPELSFFVNKINYSSNKIFKKNIRILSMWANVGSYDSKVIPHDHIVDKFTKHRADDFFVNHGICGAFYLSKPKNSGNFIAKNDIVDINENDLVYFSPHMFHSTEINKSHQDRIVISFNGTL